MSSSIKTDQLCRVLLVEDDASEALIFESFWNIMYARFQHITIISGIEILSQGRLASGKGLLTSRPALLALSRRL